MTTAVVVGSGIAGLTAALHATEAGAAVTVVTKDALEQANTRFAQGGIAGVMFADDSRDAHVADTLAAGAGLCDPAAVQVLVDEGPDRIRELIALGVAFDRDPAGDLVKGLEAAHSYPRVLHAGGDATGREIEQALVARLRASGAAVIEHAFLADLLLAEGRVCGVELHVDGERRSLFADAVILATGGAGGLYAHTTNPPVATGDGVAAALRAGAEVADLEFFQFHPTVLATGAAFLVSEAVRGEGATLIDDDGHRFAFDIHPDGELAPRDVVARAIAHRMAQQNGHPVRLDATTLGARFLARRFPTIDAAVRERGLDWAREPVPVTPAAHYLMGGVVTDLAGRTSLPGLYAVGEVARTGVHGANRLASNSLLEGAVFGARAGDAVVDGCAWPDSAGEQIAAAAEAFRLGRAPSSPVLAQRADHHPPVERAQQPHSPVERADHHPLVARAQHSPLVERAQRDETSVPSFSRSALQELLWQDAGLVRDATGLRRAAETLAAWRARPRETVHVRDLEDDNLLLVGETLVTAALARRASVGAHHRSDAPVVQPGTATAPGAPHPSHPLSELQEVVA